MRKLLLPILAIAFVVAAPAGYAGYRAYHFRNLRVVQPGLLLRSGQLSPYGLHRTWHEFGVGTIVTLRADDELRSDLGGTWDHEPGKPLPPRTAWEPKPSLRKMCSRWQPGEEPMRWDWVTNSAAWKKVGWPI